MSEPTKLDYEILSQRGLDRDRGIALLVAGAVMVLLKWILPIAAPVAALAYGIYRMSSKRYKEGALFIGVAIVLWLLHAFIGWLLWLAGFVMAGVGIFYLIRSFRGPSLLE